VKQINDLGYLPEYVEAAKSYLLKQDPTRMPVTDLINSPQIRRLFIEKFEDIVTNISDYQDLMIGSAWHKFLEPYTLKCGGKIPKWELPFENYILVGIGDAVYDELVTYKGNVIIDHKLVKAHALCDSYRGSNLKKWNRQLQVYAYLQYKCDKILADKLLLAAHIKDYNSHKQAQNKDLTPKFKIYEFPVQPIEKIEAYIKERIKLHNDTTYTCNDEDKRVKVESFAVMKEGRKSALRVLKSSEEAQSWILNNNWQDGYKCGKITIQRRKSEPKWCLDFCKCRSVCSYAQKLNK
jgi:hypothetical protein